MKYYIVIIAWGIGFAIGLSSKVPSIAVQAKPVERYYTATMLCPKDDVKIGSEDKVIFAAQVEGLMARGCSPGVFNMAIED